MIAVDTGTAELEQLPTNVLISCEIEEFLAVIAGIPFGPVSGLHAMSANDVAADCLSHYQVIADDVKLFAIQPQRVRRVQAFAQLFFKNLVTQSLPCPDVNQRGRNGNLINWCTNTRRSWAV